MVGINKNAKELTTTQLNVLTGSLLGDGCLGIIKDSINPRLTIRRQILDLPYLQYQFDIFNNLCREKAITTGIIFDKRYNKNYEYCNLESRYIPAFKPIREKWYPKGVKIIPSDLVLNPLIIAIWLCDDGSIKIQNEQRINIKFHTQGFTKDEVYFLKSLLDDRYNVKFKVQQPKHNQYIIAGYDHQSRLLLKDIDNIFPASMSRKSNIWRNPSVHFYHDEPKQFVGYGASQIKASVDIKMASCEVFTIKSICEELGLFYTNKRGNFGPHLTIKRYICKCIKDGRVVPLQNTKILSFNTELSLIKIV
jgi:hypothetical protein